MQFFLQMLGALPEIAKSWQALVGYIGLLIAFVIVSLKVTRNKNLLNKLKSLPEQDRARVLQMEMGAAYLAAGLAPEQWLQQQRQRFYFYGFLSVCVLAVALALAAMLWREPDPNTARKAAEQVAHGFVAKLYAKDFNGAYDAFPDDVRKNVSFAQFQTDMNRLLFQLPGKPLRDTVEQSVDNGSFLTVMLSSEFSVETNVRTIIGFAKTRNGWKLWHYDWQPADWPLVWPTSTETRQSASDVMKTYLALNKKEREAPLPDRLRGNITGSMPGWTLVVSSVTKDHDDHRCTITAMEPGSSTLVELKEVVGGCKLQEGRRILVNALISGVSESRIELDGVRYFPET